MTPQQLAERINRLIELYYNAGLELIEMLRTLESGYGKRKIETLIKQIDARLNELTAVASSQYADILGHAYYIGAMEAIAGIARHIPETQIDKSIQSLIHHRAVQAIMDESFYSILEATDNMSQDIKDRIQQVVQRANERSLLQGVSRRQATKDAIAELSQEQIRGIVTLSGAKVPIDKYMAGVVQYHQRKAHVTGAENIISQNGYDLVYVNRVGITCEFCVVYQGRVYSISGNDPRFPKLELRPPYHSHCVHSISAWIEDSYPPEEVERMIQESNRPFTDSRTQQNIKRYNELQREKSRKNETRKQWLRYKARLPNDIPDLRTFASQKARGTAKFEEWQELYREVGERMSEG